jgi:AcrR family transcriptional regulator
MSTPAGSIRARVRAEMIDEIKTIASRHLASDGANLSLRAVARDVGMVSSAIYRYFPSRDDLLTALIIDAYNAIGDAAERGDASTADRRDLRGRFLATTHAVRDWALAHPAEYALLYGSPVPGYVAPSDTITPAARTPVVLVRILADGVTAGSLHPNAEALPDAVRGDLVRAADQIAPGLPPELLMRGTIAWIHLFGAVSFELFGQLNNVIDARTEYFHRQMTDMADLIGLPD